jgi:hypothetical protein
MVSTTIDRPAGRPLGHLQYEYRVMTFTRDISRSDVHRQLTDEAEYGRWELARTRAYSGGVRRVWLRRRIMRVEATLRS